MRGKEHYEALGYKDAIEYYRELGWEDTGYLAPELSSDDVYPEYLVKEAEESVKEILSHHGENTITVGFMTDLHYATTHNHEIRMKRMLNAYKDIKAKVKVDALLLGGDLTNEGCKEYKSECFRELRKQFEGIDYLPANGNHDDGSIWDIQYVAGEKAVNHLTHAERYDLFYDHLPAVGAKIADDGETLYYYINDDTTKTRYICLDTGDTPRVMDNGKFRYSAQWTFSMSQKQGDWLVNDALKFDEEGWSAVFWLHSMNPPKEREAACAHAKEIWNLLHLNHIADAYKKGESINGDYYDGDFKISVNADFSKGARAEIACFLVGDYHRDMIDYTEGGVPRIFTSNAVAYRGGNDRIERNDGDKTELLFDVLTIDKTTGKIYITRVGAGNDREASYK